MGFEDILDPSYILKLEMLHRAKELKSGYTQQVVYFANKSIAFLCLHNVVNHTFLSGIYPQSSILVIEVTVSIDPDIEEI